MANPIAIIGDFNINYKDENKADELDILFGKYGFEQMVKESTYKKSGSIIDLAYINCHDTFGSFKVTENIHKI